MPNNEKKLKKSIRIIWEHFETNYLKKDDDSIDEDE
jgi:hypothetical protein